MANSDRILISAKPPIYNSLKRLSAASGRPMASIISELLQESIPSFDAISEALENIKAGRPEKAKRFFAAFALERADNLMEATDELLKKKAKK